VVGKVYNGTFHFKIAQAWIATFGWHTVQAMNGDFDHFSLTGLQAWCPDSLVAEFRCTGNAGVMTAHTEAFVHFFASLEFFRAGVGSGNNHRSGVVFGNGRNTGGNRFFSQRIAACARTTGRADYIDQQDNNKYGEYEREDDDDNQLFGRFNRAYMFIVFFVVFCLIAHRYILQVIAMLNNGKKEAK
jgi:hypothetical protein